MSNNSENIMVSIICLTYNHEKYIRQCLDGIVSQNVNFAIEAIVHDDASTDGTAKIIREYEKKYPNMICPYYQTKNAYSRNIPIEKTFLSPMIRGKYIAFCEGDDYWCNPQKLQKQVEIMESHPEIHFCTHLVRNINENGNNLGTFHPKLSMKSQVLSQKLLVWNTIIQYNFQTSSYFIRANEYLNYIQNPPLFKKLFSVGDTPLLLYLANLGDCYYINEAMSCYRINSNGSWTIRKKNSKYMQIKHLEEICNALQEYDHYTNYQFHDLIQETINNRSFEVDMIKKNWITCCSSQHSEIFHRQSLRCRTSVRIHAFLQRLKQIINRNH